MHKVKVQDLDISANDKYLVTLGGEDDGSVVVWSLDRRDAICGSPAQPNSAGITKRVCFAATCDELFFTAGSGTIRVWELDPENRKIRPTEVQTGQVKRIVDSLHVSHDDSILWCGTTSGDILSASVQAKVLRGRGPIPLKNIFPQGVTAIQQMFVAEGGILVGCGDGTLCLLDDDLKRVPKKSLKVEGIVTSITCRGEGYEVYIGTSKCHIYKLTLAEFKLELLNTCHSKQVNDVAFPHGCSDLVGTCSYEDVRVWHLLTGRELLRIVVPNMTCMGLTFTNDGKQIITGWDDGRIRAFFPESGQLMYLIDNAHSKGVTAVAVTSDSKRIISGGGEGQVRVWDLEIGQTPKGPCYVAKLRHAMKEHTATVACIRVRKNDRECVTASSDGSCIIWDLQRFSRSQVIFANTLFRCICYHPAEFQLIASGTDRKVGYWETFDGSKVRELDASRAGAVNSMDIESSNGRRFATGGDDRIVRVWRYNEGDVMQVGLGHSKAITALKICPNARFLVSCGADGALFRWRLNDNGYANAMSNGGENGHENHGVANGDA